MQVFMTSYLQRIAIFSFCPDIDNEGELKTCNHGDAAYSVHQAKGTKPKLR